MTGYWKIDSKFIKFKLEISLLVLYYNFKLNIFAVNFSIAFHRAISRARRRLGQIATEINNFATEKLAGHACYFLNKYKKTYVSLLVHGVYSWPSFRYFKLFSV